MFKKQSTRWEASGKNERRAGRAVRSGDDRFRATFEHAAVGLTHTDVEGHFLRANRWFCHMLGYKEAEVLAMPPYQLTHPDERGCGAVGKAQLLCGDVESVSREKRYLHRDGRAIWTRLTLSLARDDGGQPDCFVGVVEDITVQKRVEVKMQRLARARRVMAECNHVLVHATDEADMLAAMCRIVVDSGGYTQSWVGLALDDPEKSIHIAGEAGYPAGYLKSIRRTWADGVGLQSIMGRTIASGEQCIAQYILTDATRSEQHTRARDRGYQSSIALPLTIDGRTIGGVSIYAREPDAFDDEEIALLTELTQDIAYGVNTLRTRIAHKVIEQRFEATFNQAAVGIVQMGLDGHYLMVNERFCEMVGYSRQEIIGQTGDLVTHPDDLPVARLNRERLRSGAESRVSGEKRYVRKDGTVIWIRRTASIAYDESGKAAYTIRVLEDITDRKQFEEYHRATIMQAPIGIMHSALDGQILQANPKLCEITGYTQEQLLTMNSAEIVEAGDAASIKATQSLLAGEIPVYTSDMRIDRSDGQTVWVRCTVSAARDSAGQPLHLIGIIEDISERRDVEERYRATVEYAPVGIMHTALDKHTLYVNRKFCDMLGYTEQELLKLRSRDIISGDQYGADLNQFESLNEGKVSSFASERPLKRKDGSILWVSRTVSVVRDSAGNPLYHVRVMVDISDRKRAEEAVMRDRTLLRTVVDNLPDRIYVKDNEGRYLLMNETAKQINGIHDDSEIVGKSAYDILPYDAAMRIAQEDQNVIQNKAPIYNREKCTTYDRGMSEADGVMWHITTKVPLQDKSGNVFGIVGVNRDITDQKRAALALTESEQKFRQLAENIPEVFWITDVAQRETLYVSAAFEKITGRAGAMSPTYPGFWLRVVHADDRRRVYEARKALPDIAYNIEYRIVRPDGEVRWIHDQAFPVTDSENNTYRIAGIAADITRRKEAEEKLLHLAHYDALTGLPNRVVFYDRLRQNMAQAQRRNSSVGVMFVDLDRFKLANDTLGHAVGDLLLQQVSQRLLDSIRKGDTAARLSGDEFGVILGDLRIAEDARVVAHKMLSALAEPFCIEGHELYVTASTGISVYPADGNDPQDLLKNADTAMYRAKEAGRNTCRFYTGDMNTRTMHHLEMENGLRKALERQEFLLHYQPKVDLSDGSITGFEALLRWQRPDHDGLVSPAEFVPLLEETGLIVPVGEWLIDAACAQISAWRQEGIEPRPIAINLSARQFADKNLAQTIRRSLDAHWVDSSLLELEITESSLMNNTEEAIATLKYLKSLGLRISIDDFGTGYSSLSYLKRFPLDALKVDRSFVRDITTDADDATIALAIISMAHKLGLKVIAEGVETEAQLAFLSRNRCDQMQGYYFSKPVPAIDCGKMLLEKRHLELPAASLDSNESAIWSVYDDEDKKAAHKTQPPVLPHHASGAPGA
ncbi:MAG: PAS domain S-box protein [Burkholderiales bacterium]